MGSVGLLRSELLTCLSIPSKPPDRVQFLSHLRLSTSPTLLNPPEPPDPPDPPDLQAPSFLLSSDSKPFHHHPPLTAKLHLTLPHTLLPPFTSTLRPMLFCSCNVGLVTSMSSGVSLSGIIPVMFFKLGMGYIHSLLGYPLWFGPYNSAPLISATDRVIVLCFEVYWFEPSSVLTERSFSSPTPLCVRGPSADLLSSPLVGEMFIISPSSFGTERSISPSSLHGERTFPHSPFSMRSGFFSDHIPSKLFNILIVLLSCVAVCTGPEDATGFASSNLGDRSWSLTSQSNVTRLQQSGPTVITLLTHLSFASNPLSHEDLSILISSFLMLYDRALRGWIILSYDCNIQV